MIILRSHILGFGKLSDLSLDFQSGLNLVFAENEGGKSTLQRFLVGLLYGQLRSDLRVQRRLESWVEQYKPWYGQEFGGVLWCRLADGREMEIHRSFGKEETRIDIRASSGADITSQYEQQRNGEVLFAQMHLGMTKELFESVGVIRENKVAEIYGHETIRDRIANLAQSGDEELSIRRSLSKLQEKQDSIGSERAPTKPYKQAQDLVQALQAERKALEERRSQFQGWIGDRNRIAGEIARLEQGLSISRRELLSARRRESAEKVRALEEIDSELSALRMEIESLGARADFPSGGLEEINRLVGARDSIAKHLAEIRAEKGVAMTRLSRAESERRGLAAYASFVASPEAEQITEWFVNYLSISLQKDGLQKTAGRLQSEAETLEKRLDKLGPALMDPDADWQRLAREAAEDEQVAAQNGAILAESIARENLRFAAASRRALFLRIAGATLILFGAASVGFRSIPGFNLWSPAAGIGIGAGLAAVAAILLVAAAKSAKAGADSRQMLGNLEAESRSIRSEGGKKRREFNEVMADSGFHKVDDFLAAAKQSEQDRQKLADLQMHLADSENQRQQLEEKSAELYQLLKDGLAKVGLSCSPGSLNFQIDAFRANLRRFRDLDANYSACVQKADALKSRESELSDEHESKCAGIQRLLDEAQVETPERFREECTKKQRLIDLLEKETSRIREFQRLAGSWTLPQWREQLEELLQSQESLSSAETDREAPANSAGDVEPLLPYQPTTAEAEEKEKQFSAKLSKAREEYAHAVERIAQAFQSYRSSSEIEEDLAMAELDFRGLDTNRLALGVALETIENLSRQQQEVLAPQLNAAVEQRFLRLCRHRYEEVKIDPDFQVWLRELNSGELRPAESLSRGTQDQLYFSMRFGILDLVSNEQEPCPSLLDEPFAAYDRVRLGEAFQVLEMESARRQLILFTCREDLLDLGAGHGAHVIRLRQ
ncbi:MAG TPA: AAA family ATPase [Acidobacteriota bacterium]|nr:AAA family ATPase [Acidobacteriota bacterium]